MKWSIQLIRALIWRSVLAGNPNTNNKYKFHSVFLLHQFLTEVFQVDLYQKEGIKRIVVFVKSPTTDIGYLINSAGYFSPNAFLEHNEED